MNKLNRVYTSSKALKTQSDVLRSFTLVNIYGDEVVLLAESAKDLVVVLGSQSALDGVLMLNVLADRLWSGQVCVLAVCELVVIPDTHMVSRFDLDYSEPFSMSSPVYIVGVA